MSVKIRPDVFACLLRYMILAARSKRLVPYNEIENACGLGHNMVGHYAGMLGDFCIYHGLPLLNALIVNTKECMPSHGFDGYIKKEGNHQNWGECVSACFSHFHQPTLRELQVKDFQGLTTLAREWFED
ncbi:hypothetical protein NX722_03060 [Endozoicomonas gorgoniicola]|uniref:Uncharacterized protein n=1 Tax=Endozoicomonas gorgoniicola TaxID=1234144 RepID=A0ABT3MQJ9_9GAMM|nr:hypothetical protein [Endozoicomonas gorgoniicola]MCW7551640.1 hypothetical protein [Endozoicomonas gorgoniicola]